MQGNRKKKKIIVEILKRKKNVHYYEFIKELFFQKLSIES